MCGVRGQLPQAVAGTVQKAAVVEQCVDIGKWPGGSLRAMAQDPIENVPTEPAEVPRPITLRVITFNVWYGGEQVSLAKVGEAIRAAEADIVGVQEADENLDAIAAAAGMTFVDPRRRLISRWPIFDSGDQTSSSTSW